jgi:flagellar biogenesis protein FliO
VVEVGDQWIVVGASPGRVNALATMPQGSDPNALGREVLRWPATRKRRRISPTG